jgi:hypothetical protein
MRRRQVIEVLGFQDGPEMCSRFLTERAYTRESQ